VKQTCSWPKGVNYGKQDKNGHWGKDYCIFPSAELFTSVNWHYRKIFELGANMYGLLYSVEKAGKNGGKDFPNKSSLIEVDLTQKRKIIRLGPKK
jgi:hypothetical protein